MHNRFPVFHPMTNAYIGDETRMADKSYPVWLKYLSCPQLGELIGDKLAAEWYRPLVGALERYDIEGRLPVAHFLAQAFHESVGFTQLLENMNYSAERLMQVWPSRFPNRAIADQYARQPEKLANFVYGGRLGNTQPGDGWRYRGRGIFQLTGRANYAAYAADSGIDVVGNPDLLLQPKAACDSAAWFWNRRFHQSRRLNQWAAEDNLTAITTAINGGLNGIGDRQAWLRRIKTTI
jgi:putative chitinase